MPRPKRPEHYVRAREIYLASERLQQMPTDNAAVEIDVSVTSVKKWRRAAGLPPPKVRLDEIKEQGKRELIKRPELGLENKQSTMSIPDLCKLVEPNLPYHTVFYMQKKLGVEPFGQKYRGHGDRSFWLTKSIKDLEILKLAHKWGHNPELTKHVESLRD